MLGERLLGTGEARRTNAIYIFFASVLMIIVCLWHPAVMGSETQVQLSAEVGFNGDVKWGSWVPIRVTLTNNGPAIQGEVYLELDEHMISGDWKGTAKASVELPQGSTKTLTLIAPDERVLAGKKLFLTADGKKVADTKVRANTLSQEEFTVGVLATSPEAGAFLSELRMGDHQLPRIYELQPEDVPEVGIGLSHLDALVINNFPAEGLNANQIEAVKYWVADGGMLILGGGPEYQKAASLFQELSPVDVSGTTTLTAIDDFQRHEVHGQELKFKSPLTIAKSSLKPGAVAWVEEGDLPIVASMPWQKGEVIFTAYDLTAPPLVDWDGAAEWWERIFNSSRQPIIHDDHYPWGLMDAVDYIPALSLPSVGSMAVIFLFYVLLVGPILYLVLRRFDKRGWAWGLIPACALLVSVGIFAYGVGERGRDVLVHNVNVLKLYPNAWAELRGAAAVFVPKGGTYELQLPDTVFAWPKEMDYSTTGAADWRHSSARITLDSTDVKFEDVEFWSLRKAYVEGHVPAGTITADLTMEDGRVAGTVTNDSRWDLAKAHVLVGRQNQPIGTLKAGETKEIDMRLNALSTEQPGVQSSYTLFSSSGVMDDDIPREERLLDYVGYEAHDFQPFQSSIHLIGWTEEPVYESSIKKKPSKEHSLSLIIAPLDVQLRSGEKWISQKGSIVPSVVEASGAIDIMPDGIYASQGDGSVTFRFDLNLDDDITLNKLHVDVEGPVIRLEWFNWQTGKWEKANEASRSSLNDYVSIKGQVLVKMSLDQEDDFDYPLPTLEAEGEVAP